MTHSLSPLWHSVTTCDTVWHDSSMCVHSYMWWVWYDSFVESSMTQCDNGYSVTWLIHMYSFLYVVNVTWLIRWVLYDTVWQCTTQCDMTHPCVLIPIYGEWDMTHPYVFIPMCCECDMTHSLSPLWHCVTKYYGWYSVTWLIHVYWFLYVVSVAWLFRWVLYSAAWQRITQCDMTHFPESRFV